MQGFKTGQSHVLGASAALLALPLADLAAAADWDSWSAMNEEVVSAKDVLSADVTNLLNPVGQVSDLVLNPSGTQIQYVLFEVPYPYSFYGAEDGFATFDGIDFEVGGALTLNVQLTGEEPQGPEELTLTASEADHRLLSNIIGEPLQFSDDETRRIRDVLVDRDTGALTHYVVDMDADSLFDVDRRTLPADMVSIDEDGAVVASTDVAGVDQVDQEFDPAFL